MLATRLDDLPVDLHQHRGLDLRVTQHLSNRPAVAAADHEHAARRLSRRGIEVDSAQAQKLVTAIDRAAAKGSRTSLVLMDELALLVRIPERTVVTAMSPGAMRDGVVTQIDSAVMI